MRKTKKTILVLLTVLLCIICSQAMAQYYRDGKEWKMYCDTCEKVTKGWLTYRDSVEYKYKNCTKTPGCVIKKVVERYDWHCGNGDYGSGAHGIDVEVRRYHASPSCPLGDVSINSASPIREVHRH